MAYSRRAEGILEETCAARNYGARPRRQGFAEILWTTALSEALLKAELRDLQRRCKNLCCGVMTACLSQYSVGEATPVVPTKGASAPRVCDPPQGSHMGWPIRVSAGGERTNFFGFGGRLKDFIGRQRTRGVWRLGFGYRIERVVADFVFAVPSHRLY